MHLQLTGSPSILGLAISSEHHLYLARDGNIKCRLPGYENNEFGLGGPANSLH